MMSNGSRVIAPADASSAGPDQYERARLIHASEVERDKTLVMTLLTGCLMLMPFDMLSSIRTAFYGVVLVLCCLFLALDRSIVRLDAPITALAVVCCCLFVYLLLCWLGNGGSAVERLVQTAVYLLVLATYERYGWSERRLVVIRRAFVGLVAIGLLHCLATGQLSAYDDTIFGNANRCAVLAFACMGVILLTWEGVSLASNVASLALCLVLTLLLDSRSVFVAEAVLLLVAVLLRMCWRRGGRLHLLAGLSFVLVLVGVGAVTVIYPSLMGTDLGDALQSFSRTYFNKNFFSGRQEVWSNVLEAIEGHELFGLGLEAVPSMIYDTDYSCHNLYLQTMLQTGIVGLLLILSIIWLVYKSLIDQACREREGGGWYSVVGLAFVCGVLAHECFEVCLTQNNFDCGLWFWMIMGIAVSALRCASPSTRDVGRSGRKWQRTRRTVQRD